MLGQANKRDIDMILAEDEWRKYWNVGSDSKRVTYFSLSNIEKANTR